MHPERQIAVACTMLGGVLVYPEMRTLAAHPDFIAGSALMTGGGFGALAVFFGTLLALDGDPRWLKWILVTCSGALALGFAAAMVYGALRSPGTVRMALFGIFAALDLIAFFGTLFGTWRAARRQRAA